MLHQTERIQAQDEKKRKIRAAIIIGIVGGTIAALLLGEIAKSLIMGGARIVSAAQEATRGRSAEELLRGWISGGRKTGADFDIETYTSNVDMDGDGIDDQTDILQNAKKWVSYKPQYVNAYYDTGYPNWSDHEGVCTDVVGYALLNSGYDLQALVEADVKAHPERYWDAEDPNIDFRRVSNLLIYFQYNSINLTTDLSETSEWQGGDIVIFAEGHIGIVSDRRNEDGNPYLIHHGSVWQTEYEEDKLHDRDDIVGHFRIS